MIEVEIRARIKNPKKIKENLQKIGASFVKSKKQIDKIFGHPMFLDSRKMIIEGGLSARIRGENNKQTLEFKEISRKEGGIEIRAELDNIEEGLKFLEKLQFEEAFTVAKLRESYSYQDFNICLDKVEQLGDFIEIEKMLSIDDEDMKDKARKDCLDLLDTLVPESKVEDKKYGDLMQELIDQRKNT